MANNLCIPYYCISGKVRNVEIFVKFAIQKKSLTFPVACFVMSGKAQCTIQAEDTGSNSVMQWACVIHPTHCPITGKMTVY